MPATIRDIKDRTGLSLATISKFLNGGNVLPENRTKIEEAIKELHYEVNEIARGLVTNKTMTVGLLMYSVESPFGGQIMHYVGQRLRENGYGMLICDSCNDEEIEAKNVRYLINKKVDGIIVIPVSNSPDFLTPAKTAGIPVVLADRALPGSSYDCVRIDNRIAAIEAVNLALDNNHKKVAIIGSDRQYTGRERYEGFLYAMKKAGLEVPKEYRKRGAHSVATGYSLMRELLSLKERPTAVFADNYEVTLGAMMAINESEYSCPEDISIIGFDDMPIFRLIQPPVHMIKQPITEMAEKAVDRVLERIDSDTEMAPMEISLGTSLVKGASIRHL